jgi:hypothetical protein
MVKWRRLGEIGWFLFWAAASSAWCFTAASQLGPTFDEPIYVTRGLEDWRNSTKSGLLQLGTMPLPIDLQTLPLYLWEQVSGTTFDLSNDLDGILIYCRAVTLLFWWLLLWYARLIGRSLGGPWAGRLAVAFVACEPSLLAHASLATTDIAITACLLAFFYHFRKGREGTWVHRRLIPGIWYGIAILAKASALVFAPLCLAVIEIERLARAGAFAFPPGSSLRRRLVHVWRQTGLLRRDFLWIGFGGLALAFVYCGCDFEPHPSLVKWAHSLEPGPQADVAVWVADHLCIFSNAGEGLVRQIKHNMHGHGTYLLGLATQRWLWFYFPVLVTIKLSLPLLLAPFGVAAVRARALANWAFVAALVLLVASLNFRVQIGIRLILPLVAVGTIGLVAALVEAIRTARVAWLRHALTAMVFGALGWTAASAAGIWPHGLCYVNELWGGPRRGYRLVSDSNYDWGQGLPELIAWRNNRGRPSVDVWYFGTDPAWKSMPLRFLLFHDLPITNAEDFVAQTQGRYLAVSTTMAYGGATPQEAHRVAAEFLRKCRPVDRTATFLIYERSALVAQARATVIQQNLARKD